MRSAQFLPPYGVPQKVHHFRSNQIRDPFRTLVATVVCFNNCHRFCSVDFTNTHTMTCKYVTWSCISWKGTPLIAAKYYTLITFHSSTREVALNVTTRSTRSKHNIAPIFSRSCMQHSRRTLHREQTASDTELSVSLRGKSSSHGSCKLVLQQVYYKYQYYHLVIGEER